MYYTQKTLESKVRLRDRAANWVWSPPPHQQYQVRSTDHSRIAPKSRLTAFSDTSGCAGISLKPFWSGP